MTDRRTYLEGLSGFAGLSVLAGCLDDGLVQDDGTDDDQQTDDQDGDEPTAEDGDDEASEPDDVEPPDAVDEFFEERDVDNYDGTMLDLTGRDRISIDVGAGNTGLLFDPPAVWIDPGTAVVWEWSGEGGSHNVMAEHPHGAFDSGDPVSPDGTSYDATFESDGNYMYVCAPHRSVGMFGAVVVGEGGEGDPEGVVEGELEVGEKERPNFDLADEYLSENQANLYDGSVLDWTDREAVRITVGAGDGFAFDPPVVNVDPGTEIIWEWTGEGGRHNINTASDSDVAFRSGDTVEEEGFEYTERVDSPGTILYHCEPHVPVGMHGAILVGDVDESVLEDSEPQYTAEPDLESADQYLLDRDAQQYDGEVTDRRSADQVTIDVGADDGFAFDPPLLSIQAGTEVVWEWTGEGGLHNVVSDDQNASEFRSGNPTDEAGHTWSQTFEESGNQYYFCEPHRGIGMFGAIVVE